MLLDFKKPPYIVLEKVTSYTGKYQGFFGTHYEKGHLCYVVGAISKRDGSITARHYNVTTGCVNDNAAKAAAGDAWKHFFAGLVRKPSDEDLDADNSKQLEQWFEHYERRIQEGVRKRSAT